MHDTTQNKSKSPKHTEREREKKYWLQMQAQKNTSNTRYPLLSRMDPAAMAMRASPRFWIDCMLVEDEKRRYHLVDDAY